MSAPQAHLLALASQAFKQGFTVLADRPTLLSLPRTLALKKRYTVPKGLSSRPVELADLKAVDVASTRTCLGIGSHREG